MKISLLSAAVAIGVTTSALADYWTGKGSTTEFSDLANWVGEDKTSAVASTPSAMLRFGDGGKLTGDDTGSYVITFDANYSYNDIFHAYAGTEQRPLVFRASGSNGLTATANKEMYIGNGSDNPAYVVLDGGTYTFMNDLTIGQNHADSTLVVKEGTRVQLPHWTKIGTGSGSGESRLVIDGGEYVGGWRNDVESDNARFAIAEGTESKAIVTMNAGRIRASGGNSAGDWAFVVGTGPRSEGRFIANNGTLDVANGRIIVAGGNTATGIVQKVAGDWNVSGDVRMGDGVNSYAEMDIAGGNITAGAWFYVGMANNSYGYLHTSGGTITAPVFRIGEGYGNSDVRGLVVNDGGTYNCSGDFRIASDATRPTGVMTNNSGTVTVGANFAVGAVDGGRGEYVHNGGTLSVAGNNSIFVGRGSVGTGYYEQAGGEVTAKFFQVGSNGGNGTGKITGGTLNAPDTIYVATDANSVGVLDITGGTITAGQFFVGNGNNADAKVSITNTTVSFSSWGAVGRSGTGRKAKVTVGEGGRLIHTATDNNTHLGIGNLAGDYSENELVVEEGGYVRDYSDIWLGEQGPATLTINGGTVRAAMDNGCRWVFMNQNVNNGYATTLNLNGGALETGRLTTGSNNGATASGTATVNFNGGTLRAVAGSNRILEQMGNMTVNICENGGTIDTGAIFTEVTTDLNSGVDEGETDGGLTVTGKGILALHAAANYNGLTKVEQGVLDFRNGMSFTGPVEIGKNGAITVEVTPVYTAAQEEIAAKQAEYDAEEVAEGDEHQVVVPTVADLLLNKKIALFSASALSFEEATDDITTSVFLTGPVVGYTLSSETADGRTTVYATITDVTNIATSRKVTTFVTGTEFDDTLADPLLPHHVDQDAAYSNKQPANNSYDVVVFPSDAVMYIWSRYYKNRDEINNRCFGDLVVRGGTVSVVASNGSNARWPSLGVKHVAGNGTLYLARIGLNTQNHTSLVVDEHVNVEASTQGIRTDIPATQDVWFGGTGTTTVNGDVYVTNGVMKVQAGVTFNGDVAIGYYQPLQSWLDVDGTVFNGDLILGDGATFNCNGKTATFGEDARLVLKGGTLINTNNIAAWPKTVIQGGVYAYGAVPGAAEYTIEGGKLNVVPTTDESGATITLTGVTLAAGVNAEDVIQMAGTNFKWRYTVDPETGDITAEAYEALDSSIPNGWIGGAQGMWKQASNWTRGIPTIDQTVVFNNDAICFYAEKQEVWGAAGLLDLNGHSVTIAASNYDNQYWGGLRIGSFDESETGTLNLWKAGIWNKNGSNLDYPATMLLTVDGGSDCWLRDDYGDHNVNCMVQKKSTVTLNLDYNIHLKGGVSGPGAVTARNKADRNGGCRLLGGDWSGFTGTYTGHGSDRTRFLDSFAGGENSTWSFPQYIRIDKMSGVIKFGQVTFTNDRRIEVPLNSTVAVEVGALNGNPSLNSGTCFYNNTASDWTGAWTQGSATATIKKVGTGTMTCGMIADANIDVAEGICSLVNGDAKVNVTVREGATLLAANNVTIGSLACEAGANIRLTTLESNPVITVDGTAVVDGANVTLADGLADMLYAQTDPASYTILNAGTISGTPAGKFACDEKNVFWLAKAASGTLKLARRLVMDGLFIIVH